jgi:uncharacterized membrane protein HdeD (DUF308 family)
MKNADDLIRTGLFLLSGVVTIALGLHYHDVSGSGWALFFGILLVCHA